MDLFAYEKGTLALRKYCFPYLHYNTMEHTNLDPKIAIKAPKLYNDIILTTAKSPHGDWSLDGCRSRERLPCAAKC